MIEQYIIIRRPKTGNATHYLHTSGMFAPIYWTGENNQGIPIITEPLRFGDYGLCATEFDRQRINYDDACVQVFIGNSD